MATKKKPPLRELPSIPADLVDQFVKGPMTAEAVQDLSMAFKKALIERALGAEPGHHLGYPQAEIAPSKPLTSATAEAARRCSPTMGRCRWTSRVTATAASRRS